MSEYSIKCSNCNGTGEILVNWIGYRRKELGLSQSDVAKVIGVQRSQISNVERGYSSLTSDKVLKLADLLQITADGLLRHMHGASNE